MVLFAGVTRRVLGFGSAVALVVGNTIGSGVFVLPASLAAYGGLSLAGWVLTTAGAICVALVFARLARLAPMAGGPYAYTRAAFGDLPGFLIAWGYWISIWCATAALAIAGVSYLGAIVPPLVRTPGLGALSAIALVWIFILLNRFGLRPVARVQVITTIIKVLPLVLIGIGGLWHFRPEAFAIAAETPGEVTSGVTAAAALTLFAFIGIESGTIPADTIANPERTIPRATVYGTVLTAMIYVASTVGVMSLVPAAQLATTTAPFADAARILAGDGAATLVALAAAISCLGALNGWTLIVGELPKAVAHDGLFPSIFARLSTRGTPDAGMIIAGILTTTIVASNFTRGLVGLYTFVILLSTLATLVPYAFCSMALFRLDRTGLTTGLRVVASFAFVYALWAITGAGAETVMWGFVLLLSGLPVFVWVTRRA